MNRQETIKHACETVSLAYRSIGDYSKASDGFCYECEAKADRVGNYSNEGEALAYVRSAVLQQLKRDGIEISEDFNAETGDQIL